MQETVHEWRGRTGHKRTPRREERQWRWVRPDLHRLDDVRESQMMNSAVAITAMMTMLSHLAGRLKQAGLSNPDTACPSGQARGTQPVTTGASGAARRCPAGAARPLNMDGPEENTSTACPSGQARGTQRESFSADDSEKLAWLLGDFAQNLSVEDETGGRVTEPRPSGSGLRGPVSAVQEAGGPGIQLPGRPVFLVDDCDKKIPTNAQAVAMSAVQEAGPPRKVDARPTDCDADDFSNAFGHCGLIQMMRQADRDAATESAFDRTVENRLRCLAQQRELTAAAPPELDKQQLHQQRIASLLGDDEMFERKLRYETHADRGLDRALRRLAMMRRTSVDTVLAGLGRV